MGKKGKTARLKRKPAPAFWPIHRKELPWVAKPSSGSHSLEKCLPLTLVLRDILGVAQTRKEGKLILAQGKVLVDGKVRKKDDFPVGLMDVISMPDMDKYYRVMPSHKGLVLAPISKEESNTKLVRVEDKTTVHNGVQIALHDGSNMLIKVADPKNPARSNIRNIRHPQSNLSRKTSSSKLENQRRKLGSNYWRKKHRQTRQDS